MYTAVVAASAVAGKISNPAFLSTSAHEYTQTPTPKITCTLNSNTETTTSSTNTEKVIPGFPESIKGQLLFCNADNLNTDAIYPGKYTYMDELTPEDMAKVAMENYDPMFVKMVNRVFLIVYY